MLNLFAMLHAMTKTIKRIKIGFLTIVIVISSFIFLLRF